MLTLKMKAEYVEKIFNDGEYAYKHNFMDEAQEALYLEMKRALMGNHGPEPSSEDSPGS